MRTRTIAVIAVLLCSRTAFADRPDGLDCDKFPEIPANRCAQWKQLNVEGKWWCHWDHPAGRLNAIFGFRGKPIEHGLDISRITRDTARNDAAIRALLEAYGRQQIRDHEDVFGLKPHGYELRLVDFFRRPAGAHRVGQEDGSVTTETLPAVTAIRYEQRVKGAPLLEATLELQVDDSNCLLSAFSTLVGDVPPNLPKRFVSVDAAIATVAGSEAPGVDFSLPENEISAIPTYSLVANAVVPTIEVFVSVEGEAPGDETVEETALVDGRSGAILEVRDAAAGAAEFVGFSDGNARLFVDHPPFEVAGDRPDDPVATTITSPAEFIAALQTVPIHHLRTPLPGGNFRLADGYFARVENHRFANWESSSGAFIIPSDLFSMLVDYSPYDSDVENSCKGYSGNGPFPDNVELADNELWESRLDEVSAYSNIDRAATYYFERYGFQLGRSSEAKPSLHVKVESATQAGPAYFAARRDAFGANPIVVVHHGWCWRIVNGGNNVPLFGSGPSVDLYSLGDVSRYRDVMFHEFTHAVNWNIADLGEKGYSKPFQEGVADFFPLSSRYEAPTSERPIFGPGFNNNDLDPFDRSKTPPIEIDRATPYWEKYAHPDGDEHTVGIVWSNFLWDLRKRATLVQEELSTLNVSQHSAEDLQFEAFFRMGANVPNFGSALRNLLAADAEHDGKQLSYELITSAARHGIKQTRAIAGAEPNRFVVRMGIDTNLQLTVYSGSNHYFSFIASRDPEGVRTNGATSAAVFDFECSPPRCKTTPILEAVDKATGSPFDEENLRYILTIDSAHLVALVGTASSPVVLFYRTTTWDLDPADPNPLDHLDEQVSDIPGAGWSFRDVDLPTIVLVPVGSTGCACSLSAGHGPGTRGAPTLLIAAGVALLLVRRTRRQR